MKIQSPQILKSPQKSFNCIRERERAWRDVKQSRSFLKTLSPLGQENVEVLVNGFLSPMSHFICIDIAQGHIVLGFTETVY